jgi:hypothetical protein
MIRWHALWVALLLTVATCAWAQEPPAASGAGSAPPVSWSSLSEQQQKLLENFHSQWDSLPPARQQALSSGAQRWSQMTPAQRDGAQGRFHNWQQLPPGQQSLIRQRWQRFQQLTPDQQAAIRQNYHAFSGLPPAQRLQLRQRWLNATPQERQQMLQNQRARRLQHGSPGFRHFSPTPPPEHR